MLYKDFDSNKFLEQRKKLFSLIDKEIALDGHHKSYEGHLAIHFNNRFEYDENEPKIYIELSCYLAPINGRGCTFDSQEEIDELIKRWENYLQENETI